MGLVYRNGRPYLYHPIRRGGRVTSQYLASGTRTPCSSHALEADERDERRFDLQAARSERKELDDLERALDEMAEQARDLAREALTAAGYHQHHRGKWRKCRVPRHREGEAGERMMDNWAVGKLIDWAAGKDGNEKTKARLKEELCELAAELAGPSPSPVETSARRDRRNVVGSPSGCMKPTMRVAVFGRGNDPRPIRARSATDGSSPPPTPEHREDARRRAPARRSGPANQRRSPASQSTQRRGIIMKGADGRIDDARPPRLARWR